MARCSRIVPLASVGALLSARVAAQQLGNPVIAAFEGRIYPAGASVTDQFGAAVALDGDTLVVGAPQHAFGALATVGAAWVFVRSGTSWSEQAMLVASDGLADDYFGYAVDVSGDTIVVGAYRDDHPSGNNGGSVYVFVRNGTSWSQQAKLVGSTVAAADLFGSSVALDGDTLAVGSTGDEAPGAPASSGAATVFVRSGATWTEQAVFGANDPQGGDQFGKSVALDGDTLLVGSWLDDDLGTNSGSAYVFVRSGTTWSQQAKLLAGDGAANDEFGTSVGLSGERAVVGAPLDDSARGAAYAFERSGATWSELAKLVPPGIPNSSYAGDAVAIDGDFALIGVPRDPVPGSTTAGSAFLFRRSGAGWTRETKVVNEAVSPADYLGGAVAISGAALVAGALNDVNPFNGRGTAWLFRLTNTPQAYCTAKTNSKGCVPAIGFAGTPSATSASPFLVTASNVINNKNGLLFYGFTLENNAFQGGWLCIAPPTVRTALQGSGGNPPPDDCSGSFAYDFNAHIQSGVDPHLVVGADVYCEYWSRDPATTSTTGLTNALQLAIQP